MSNYDKDCLEFALIAARKSPDPSTQNGAYLACNDGYSASACNEFPRGVQYKDERWERPIKYSYIEHAERNVIYRAAQKGLSTDYATLYCPWFACADCARAIIQAGIVRCVGLDHTANTHPRWIESIKVAMEMLGEAGVACEFIDHKFGIQLRRDGQLITF